jgi:hypothetical protein
MNPEAKVLQSLDAVQDLIRRMRTDAGVGHKDELAREALQALTRAPWSMVMRTHEAEQHGWLTELQENLEHLEDDPEGSDADDAIDQALWCSLELERDLRDMVGAR